VKVQPVTKEPIRHKTVLGPKATERVVEVATEPEQRKAKSVGLLRMDINHIWSVLSIWEKKSDTCRFPISRKE
jgi:hypothetical protein